jgi:integrase
MRHRKQTGYLFRRRGWWILRYRVTVCDNGELRKVQRAKQLVLVDAEHRTRASVQHLIEEVLRPLNQQAYAPETITRLGQFVKRIYLPHVAEQKRASTSKGYKNKWNLYLESRCSEWWLREVRTCDVQRLLDEIAREHDLTRTSLRHVKALLSAIFSYARQQGFYDNANPVQGTAIPKARASEETYAYSLEEVNRMLSVLPEPAATIVATAAFTGLRRSEIRGLIWENYTGQELRVTRSIWNSVADEPKTDKSKAPVPVISQLRMMLEAHRTTCGNPKIGPIFVNELGKAQCLNNVANRSILPILHRCANCRKNREEHKDADHQFKLDTSCVNWHGWHAFRRGLATNLNRLSVPAKTIQAILRHANLNTTMNVYVKSIDQDSVRAMQSLDAIVCSKRALDALPLATSLQN